MSKHIISKLTSALAIMVLTVLMLSSCSVNSKPRPINIGKDACDGCQMTIVDNKFACEIITVKGRVLKFDDLTCLFHYIAKGRIAEKDVLSMYVADYSMPNSLIDIKTAKLVLGDNIQSPMNGGVAAFKDLNTAQKFVQETKSVILDSWERLKIQH